MKTLSTVEPVLGIEERRIVEAAVARILPSRRGAGAIEAGCPAYALQVFETRYRGSRGKGMLRGLKFIRQVSEQLYDRSFADLEPAEQDGVLLRVQQTPHPTLQDFFHRLVRLTLEGFLCHPKHGGNIAQVGWIHLGFCELGDAEADTYADDNSAHDRLCEEIDPCTTP